MNKTAIKNYAVWARVQLIESCKQRAYEYGITEDVNYAPNLKTVGSRILTDQESEQRNQLIDQIRKKGFAQVMEEAAYTWFNRFIALRFMEVNGYLPSKVRVFTDESGAFKPEILKEAMTIEIEGIDRSTVIELLEKQNNEALYKYLMITQCNALSAGLPYMFEKISNWTELLFPANLLRNDSVAGRMISDISEEDWTDAVQIIGWLYQYYNSELKDETFALLKKNVKITKERIPAATQLFTPDWIVRYMVENSLGRLWYEGHKDFDKSKWKYYLDEAEQVPEVEEQLAKIREEYSKIKPEEIKIIDPCMGSGHILVYAFDVLMQIYTSAGWSERDAARSILENNLYGLDIDDRAGQLAYFAVMMKARKYNRRILDSGIRPRVMSINESNAIDINMDKLGPEAPIAKKLIKELEDAKEYGSILKLTVTKDDLEALKKRLEDIDRMADYGSLIAQYDSYLIIESLYPLVEQAEIMIQKYDVVVTNPPYMGAGGMSNALLRYIKGYYPDTKTDLFSVFMERSLDLIRLDGFMAMITMQGWLFLSSFEKIRKIIINNSITSLIHIGYNSFPELNSKVTQAVSFVVRNTHLMNYAGTYLDLTTNYGQSADKEEAFFDSKQHKLQYECKAAQFEIIPGHPLLYTASKRLLTAFQERKLGEIAKPRQGLATGDNGKFTRIWFEVSFENVFLSAHSRGEAEKSGRKWFPYNKGGEYRKWYGNNDWIVDWSNDGAEIRNFRDDKGKLYSRPQNMDSYFQPSITWSKVSTSGIAFRFKDWGHIFDVAGTSIFAEPEMLYYLLVFCNSVVAGTIAKMISPTVNYEVGHVSSFPIIVDKKHINQCCELAKESIRLSKDDWDSFELSWDFKRHPIV